MKTIRYTITFYSDWHTGSGLTSGSNLDALVIKDKYGLPYIPGRTLKGLLKDAADELFGLGALGSDFIEKVFGLPTNQPATGSASIDLEDKGRTKKGECFFSNATISGDLSKAVIANQLHSFFYRSVASTAINGEKGIAKKHSLRVMETTIPCTLSAEITEFPDIEGYQEHMENCLKWIKRLGQNRNRGLGRCKFELKKEEALV